MSRTYKDRPYEVQARDWRLQKSGQSRVFHTHGNAYGYWNRKSQSEYRECDAHLTYNDIKNLKGWEYCCSWYLEWVCQNWHRSIVYYKRLRSKTRRHDIRIQLSELRKSMEWEETDIFHHSKLLYYWFLD